MKIQENIIVFFNKITGKDALIKENKSHLQSIKLLQEEKENLQSKLEDIEKNNFEIESISIDDLKNGLSNGDLKKIEKMTNKCYDNVRKTIIYGTRRNQEIIAAAKVIYAFNKKNQLSKS